MDPSLIVFKAIFFFPLEPDTWFVESITELVEKVTNDSEKEIKKHSPILTPVYEISAELIAPQASSHFQLCGDGWRAIEKDGQRSQWAGL